MQGRDPAVTAAVYCFNKNRIVGGVAERIAQALDGAADAAVEIDEDILRPKFLPQFLPGHHLIGVVEQEP